MPWQAFFAPCRTCGKTIIMQAPAAASDEEVDARRFCHSCQPAPVEREQDLVEMCPTAYLDAVMAGMNKALGLPPELSAQETIRLAKRRAKP